ncbi:MAG: hypothetical protein NC399_08885 [Muribaculum sp.]|nr:hypothetical protein [Muribaculum sp.]
MDEVNMLISGVVMKDGRKIVRVSFLRGKDYAEGILPDGLIEKSGGFTEEEVLKLENYMRVNRQEILKQAKEVNPLKSWLRQ